MKFADWTPAAEARVVDLRPDGAMLDLIEYYAGPNRKVLDEVFGQAYSLGAQTAVIEYRYLDQDYRSEHSRFYSTTFRRYPSVAHRVHFFACGPPDNDTEGHPLDYAAMKDAYLGFVVLRPLAGARVGRVALTPPGAGEGADGDLGLDLTCRSRETVNVFGTPMGVETAPFMAQDAQLGVCAHMALWVVAQHHHLTFDRARQTVGEIADLVPSDLGLGRPSPSTGLTVDQLAAGCREMGLPALIYKCGELPDGETELSIVCRYLNSGMPVIVAAGGHHAFTLVGYRRHKPGEDDERIHFVRQDDEAGPFQVVKDFKHDVHGPWDWLIVPLPPKVFMPGEIAEELGSEQILQAAGDAGAEGERLVADIDDEKVSFRSTVIQSNRFKTTLTDRGVNADITRLYHGMQMPRWVWVVEAIHRDERARREPAVAAEAIIDATDHSRDPHVLAWRVPGTLWTWQPDHDAIGDAAVAPQGLVDSVARFAGKTPLPAQPQ